MNKKREDFVVKVDGIGLYARSFTSMKREDAIKRMETDGISDDASWAGKAYDKLVEEVRKKDEQQEAQPEAKAKVAPQPPAKTFLMPKDVDKKAETDKPSIK